MRQERLQEYCCEVRRVRNLYKDGISSLMMDHVKYLYDGTMPRRMGNRDREWSPYGIYPAKDGYYALGVGTENSIQLWRVTCFSIWNCWRMSGVDLITKE